MIRRYFSLAVVALVSFAFLGSAAALPSSVYPGNSSRKTSYQKNNNIKGFKKTSREAAKARKKAKKNPLFSAKQSKKLNRAHHKSFSAKNRRPSILKRFFNGIARIVP